ncbi:MAG: hypothetical protein VYE40_08385, partial [Myxococcota bacterium]|nr:hypothetical protein [Myxococcota bacterium]
RLCHAFTPPNSVPGSPGVSSVVRENQTTLLWFIVGEHAASAGVLLKSAFATFPLHFFLIHRLQSS